MTTPTGVFVRLPLTNEQIGKLLCPTGTLNERLISIGTPVMDSGLEVVSGGIGTEYQVRYNGVWQTVPYRVWLDEVDSDKCRSYQKDFPKLVRQSDHLAALASLQAEVGRLRAGLARIETQANEYPGDDAAALGWIVSECDALKGPEA